MVIIHPLQFEAPSDDNHVTVFFPQETTITEIKQKIMKIPDANGIVIDGFPRDVGQALSFEDQVSWLSTSSMKTHKITSESIVTFVPDATNYASE